MELLFRLESKSSMLHLILLGMSRTISNQSNIFVTFWKVKLKNPRKMIRRRKRRMKVMMKMKKIWRTLKRMMKVRMMKMNQIKKKMKTRMARMMMRSNLTMKSRNQIMWTGQFQTRKPKNQSFDQMLFTSFQSGWTMQT